LISVGILGEYIGRIYEEVRSRPKFIVDRAEGFPR
jgi:dolichol-phosphate mannosyltransferase